LKFEEFESMIIRDIIEQYPEYKQKLQAQLASSTMQKRTFYMFGFSTEYAVSATEHSLGEGVNLNLSSYPWNVNGLEYGSDYILWIKNGLIHSFEGFSYQELWPEEILWCEKMSHYIVSMQFRCERPLKEDLLSVPSPRKACRPAAQEGVYNTPNYMVYETKESVEEKIYEMFRTYEPVIAEVRAQGGRVRLYITQHTKDAGELALSNPLLRFLAEQDISLGVD
jgi:hypothetical protein